MLGITIGYHRLWSHRSFVARRPLRFVLAILGTMGCQGSIKWWCSRHRLHHRYTDDPIHDPYAATLGLMHAHVGWIFRRPVYEKMKFVDRSDLERDPVVRFQHQYYIPLTITVCYVLPALIAQSWGDPAGGLLYGGFVARVIIWHCTFLVNSLAHWDGLQPYTDEVTARGNLFLAILTAGEGNHNFHHAFPRDYRASPHILTWDPSRWTIDALAQWTPLVRTRRVTSQDEILEAVFDTAHRRSSLAQPAIENVESCLDTTVAQIAEYIADTLCHVPSDSMDGSAVGLDHQVESRRAILFVDGWIVDASDYLAEHPGGAAVMKPYIVKLTNSCWVDATAAFHGGLNNHSRNAIRRLTERRVAKVDPGIHLRAMPRD
ncbi:putative stearoyl-CoA desaturase [Clavulina sp. PMI_390]|nr:putative stearoyl-CoA desaturase [Clavulina sp. PMI_390]